MSDSDSDFERFLQEDEESLSPKPTSRKLKPSGAYSASSGLAVTAAAAALLSTSKFKKTKGKSLDKKKSKRASKTQLSDSEEPPPSYYDDYTSGANAGLDDSVADPYAFDMNSAALVSSIVEENDTGTKKKKKKENLKSVVSRVAVKSAPISMQDRIAEILKRTGSTQFQAEDDKSDEDDISDKESKEMKVSESVEGNEEKTQEDAAQNYSDAEHSSSSDSLGMVSADFEVRLPPNPRLDRISLSSLDSENFAVNRDALQNEPATPSRYEQQQMTLLSPELDGDNTAENDEYEDDDFELELHRTILEDDKDSPSSYSSDQDQSVASSQHKQEDSFVSQSDKIKTLMQVDSGPIPTKETSEEGDVDQNSQEFQLKDSQMYLSTSIDVQQGPIDENGSYGYGNDDVEETERSQQASVVIAGMVQATEDDESSAEYGDDDFEPDTAVQNEEPNTVPSETQPMTTKDEQYSVDTSTNSPGVDRGSKVDALLAAKYGDFCTLEDDDEPAKNDHKAEQKTAPYDRFKQDPISHDHPVESTAAYIPTIAAPESPPSSPPPPAPPADDEEDEAMHTFTLDGPRTATKTSVMPHTSTVMLTVRESYSVPSSAADRFRKIESHVASLRFVQPAGTPSIAAANSPFPEPVHPVTANKLSANQAGVHAPLFEPLSISFDENLLDEEETQREIDEFVRSSQILRQEKREAAQRSSILRENKLVLRLQQAQRQILQLKEHIHSNSSAPTTNTLDSSTKIKRIDSITQEDKEEAEELTLGAKRSTISQDSYQKLEKEIKTQDTLIAAFQRENERLMQQLKQVRQDVQYNVHEANEELRQHIKKLQDQIGGAAFNGSGNTNKAQYRVAVEARLDAEAHALALQEELSAAKLSYQQKLNEVTLELDRVKKSKLELECRYEGVDLIQVAQEAQHGRQVQNELELCKKEHTHALNTLQKKLDWYVENQRLLDDQDEELRRLRRQVTTQMSEQTATPLKVQQVNAQVGGPSPARGHRRSPNDIRRIQELESRLVELEEAMRRRHPDSLSNLILASRRADDESKTRALEHDYEEKVAALSRELEQVHDANEKKLASFRQQQEKLLLQYRRKTKEQEKQLKQFSSKVPLTQRQSSKETTTTSDVELAKVRRFYTDKIKELERKWEAKYRAVRKQQYSGLSRSDNQQTPEGLTYADSALVIANLQKEMRAQEMELKREKAKVEQLEAESQLIPPSDSVAKFKQEEAERKELQEQIKDLKTQLKDSESARARVAQTLTTVQSLGLARALNPDTTTTAMTELSVSKQTEAELVQVRLELTEARNALSNERSVSTEKFAIQEKRMTEIAAEKSQLEAKLADIRLELQSLRSDTLEAQQYHRSLETQARRVPELEEELLSLRRELELPRTPSMVQYRSLELKVATLEQKHKLREAELKVVLDRALTSTRLEQLSQERAHRAAIGAKNAEIASFKRQLEEILDELALLQQPSSRPLNVQSN